MIETEAPLGRRLLAEFVGAGLLVAIGAGAVTAFLLSPLREQAARTAEITPRGNSGIPPRVSAFESDQFFQVLLRGGPADLLPSHLHSLWCWPSSYALGGVSGGHFNPAVTFSLAAVRRFPWTEVGPYMAAQIAGGIVGALLIVGVYGQDGAAFADVDILFGATPIAAGVSQWQALLAEALVTFVLVTAIMAVAIDPRGPKAVAGLIIGLSLGAGILMVGPITGASANFARSLGPIVASLLYETGAPAWGHLGLCGRPGGGSVRSGLHVRERFRARTDPPPFAPEPLGESSVSVSEEGDG